MRRGGGGGRGESGKELQLVRREELHENSRDDRREVRLGKGFFGEVTLFGIGLSGSNPSRCCSRKKINQENNKKEGKPEGEVSADFFIPNFISIGSRTVEINRRAFIVWPSSRYDQCTTSSPEKNTVRKIFGDEIVRLIFGGLSLPSGNHLASAALS
jgi:hypothetical protein